MNKELIVQFFAIFIITNILGMLAGHSLIQDNIHATIINDNPDGVENGVGIIVWILCFTAILILLLRYGPPWITYIILKALESVAVFGSALIVMYPFPIDENWAFVLALGLICARIVLHGNLLLRNASTIIAAAGSGALIGASLGTIPLAVFVALLAIYDFIAVFKTRHMVELAKGISGKNLAFTFALPTKEKKFELGTGDIVVPLAFAVSVMGEASKLGGTAWAFAPAIILLASSLGLFITLEIAAARKQPLPALPLQAIYMLLAFGLMKFTFLA